MARVVELAMEGIGLLLALILGAATTLILIPLMDYTQDFDASAPQNGTFIPTPRPLAIVSSTHRAPYGATTLLHSLVRASVGSHTPWCGLRRMNEAVAISWGLKVGRGRLMAEAMEMKLTALGVQLEEAMRRLDEAERRRGLDVTYLKEQVEERKRELAAVKEKVVERESAAMQTIEEHVKAVQLGESRGELGEAERGQVAGEVAERTTLMRGRWRG
ncbi:unnamed protein product [Closterium sp. Naga37s-1]|nr:unnamed protein product [Closterium sp. Naga37s-1]